MQKDLDQLLNELSTIERDPKQKQQSIQKLLKRIHHPPKRKPFNNWKPAFALIMLVIICGLYFLTLQTDSSMQNSVRAESMMDLLKSEDIHFNSMDISTSHSLTYTPRNSSYYFGYEKEVDPFSSDIYSTEDLLATAIPIKNVNLKKHETSISDVQAKFYNSNSAKDEILFLKFVFLDSTDKLLYVKDVDANQWYKIEGEPAKKLQKIKYTTNTLDSGFSILYFYTGIYMLSFLIGVIIQDKFPVIKRTPIFIDKKHKYIDRSICFGFILIILGSLYYFGVVHIAMVMVLSFIYWGSQLYMELKHRPKAKRHFLIINQMIQAILYLIGAIWIGFFR